MPLGAAFLKEVTEGFYDAIIVDSSDPVGEFFITIIPV
jgi:spermidine synthase